MNKCELLGRLTRDPEMRTTQNMKAVANITLAIRRNEEESDFINIVAFDKTAELIGKHVRKGQQLAVVGRIQTRNYDDKEGKKIYVTEVVASEIHFCDSKKEEGQAFTPVTDDDLPF